MAKHFVDAIPSYSHHPRREEENDKQERKPYVRWWLLRYGGVDGWRRGDHCDGGGL